MILNKNIRFAVIAGTSKSGKQYYALGVCIGTPDKYITKYISYLTKTEYEFITSLQE